MRPADVAAANRTRTPNPHTQAAIQHLHQALAHEPDHNHKAVIANALNQLMRLQAQIMSPPQQNGGQGG